MTAGGEAEVGRLRFSVRLDPLERTLEIAVRAERTEIPLIVPRLAFVNV